MARKRVNTKKVTTVVVNAPRQGKRQRRTRVRTNVARPRLTACGREYAMCALDPHGGKAAKIPDGACSSVLIEYDLAVGGVPDTTGNLTFVAMPGLPCSAIGIEGTFQGPNREGVVTGTAASPASQFVMFPFGDFKSGVTSAVAGTSVLYDSTTQVLSARVVSQRLEVIAVGAVVQQGGSSVTARVPIFTTFIPSCRDDSTLAGGQPLTGGSYHPYFASRGLTSLSYTAISAYPDSVIRAGTEPVVLISVPSDQDFRPVECNTFDSTGNITVDSYPIAGRIVTAGSAASGGWLGASGNFTAAMIPSSTSDIASFGNFWMPEESVALAWSGTGLQAQASYVFRVRTCMELCVDHGGSSYRPFVTPPEQVDLPAISLVKDAVATMPASMPKTDSSAAWWTGLTEAAVGFGSIISDMGIPVASPLAGVLSKAMKRLIS